MARQVSVLGLGAMGAALASAFLKAGYETTVWNRTAARAKPLVDNGARHASSAAECISASSLVIICILNKDTVLDTLGNTPSASLTGDKVIVNVTSASPASARETAEFIRSLAPASGVKYVQGGIMAVPQMIGLPISVILYSGDQDGFRKVESDLALLGTSKFLGLDVGLAPLYDYAMLSGMNGLISGFLHAIALVRAYKAANITAAEFTKDFLGPWLQAITAHLQLTAQQIDDKDYSAGGSPLGMQRVTLGDIIESSEALGVRADALRPLYGYMVKRVEAGGSDEGLSSLIEVFETEN